MRNVVGSEMSYPKREALRATIDSAGGIGPFTQFGANVSPQLALGIGHRATGFNLFPPVFSWLHFYSLSFQIGMFTLPLYVSSI